MEKKTIINPSLEKKVVAKSNKFLADLVTHTKYANYIPELKRRQTWSEAVDVLKNMHKKKYPMVADKIEMVFENFVKTKKILPSMRSVQFGGLPIELAPNRIFNCSYAPIDHPFIFSELLFLLLGGTGTGYSVRQRHIKNLPMLKKPDGQRRFMVGDSIEGWADSVRQLTYAYFYGKAKPLFDYRDVRKKGSIIKKTGGRAPGSTKLKLCHDAIDSILSNAIGRRLTTLENHDITCHLANCVLAGGIREAAMISIFDLEDMDMVTCKGIYKLDSAVLISETNVNRIVKIKLSENQKMNTNVYGRADSDGYLEVEMTKKFGDWDYQNAVAKGELAWYYIHPQRARANNSVALRRGEVKKKQFMELWRLVEETKSGDPGILWVNDDDSGTNPCFSGSMRLNTENGYKTFKELWIEGGMKEYSKEKNAEDYGFIKIINSKGIVTSTNVFRTSKNIDTYKLKLKDGTEFISTENHNYKVIDGKSFKKVQLKDLKIGDKLPINQISNFGNFNYPDYAELAGWVIGDGSVSKPKNSNNQQRAILRFWNDEVETVMGNLREKMKNVYAVSNSSSNQNPEYNGYDMNTNGFKHKAKQFLSNTLGRLLEEDGVVMGDKHNVPKRIWQGNKETVSAFLRGIFSADGSVQINHKRNCVSIRLWQKNKHLLQEIKILLNQFNIKSSVIKRQDGGKKMMNDGKGGMKEYNVSEQYELLITNAIGCRIFIDNIGFIQDYKLEKLKEWFNIYYKDSEPAKPRIYSEVISIEYNGKEEVFCVNEPIDNEICVNGVLTFNCGEIALNPNQFCNLTTAVVSELTNQEDLNELAAMAAFVGTLQAGYTDFHYLRPIWQETTEKEALLGVSMTGIASGAVLGYDLVEAAKVAVAENIATAAMIGINPAARVSCIKPEGSGTLAAGIMGSGIHAIYGRYIIRNNRIKKHDPTYKFLKSVMPDFLEDEFNNEADGAVISIPMAAPAGSITRSESTMDMLERIKRFSIEWVKSGHKKGINTHNVSATIYVHDNEWEMVAEWMWENRNNYNGLTCLPFSGGNYKQAPFIEIDKEKYDEMMSRFPENVDFTKCDEENGDAVVMSETLACSGGSCEII